MGVTGRFEEDLIEHRRIELQSFVDRICRHPVLANSEVWRHFLTQTDDKKWTQGKRKLRSIKLRRIIDESDVKVSSLDKTILEHYFSEIAFTIWTKTRLHSSFVQYASITESL